MKFIHETNPAFITPDDLGWWDVSFLARAPSAGYDKRVTVSVRASQRDAFDLGRAELERLGFKVGLPAGPLKLLGVWR